MQTSAPAENIGYVTSLEDVDLPYIEECLKAEPEQITRAGLLPPDYLVQNFAYHFPPNVSFSYVLGRMTQLAKTDPRYFLCEANSDNVAHYLDEVPDLEAHDKLVILKAPINGRDPQTADLVKSFAECLAQNKRGSLLDLRHVDLNILDMPVSGDREYLRSLEFLHRSLVLYLWLSYRCGGVFTDRTLATHVKEIVEIKMHRALTEFSANAKLRKASSLRKQIALLKQMRSKQLAESGESAESEGHGVTEVSQEDSELEELKRKLKEETRKEKESRRKQWMKEKQLMEESGEQWAKERLLADETEGKAAPSTAG
jgi:ATP-dependent RNA helicase SUPV3L1/SUV3